MADVLGAGALLLNLLMVSALVARRQRFTLILLTALTLRTSAALIHYYVLPLPGGLADAVGFERTAWEFSQDIWGTITDFRYSTSYIYSLFLAIPYAFTDRSPLMLQAFSVLVGTLNVYLVWKLASELWGREYASRPAWIVAIFPIPVMYAALTMREAYITFFVLLALLFVARWVNSGKLRHLAGSVVAFGMGAAFHGGIIVGLLSLVALIVLSAGTGLAAGLVKGRVPLRSFAIVMAAVIGLLLLFLVDPSIPKLGRPTQLLGPERYLQVLGVRARGDASYPVWLVASNGLELVYLVPLRVAYFLFSPFPWDVRQAAHFIGLADGLIFMALTFAVAANFDLIKRNKAALMVFLILAGLIVAFSMGTSNFGTALRHRSKFVFILVILAVPAYTRLRRKIAR
ncbi:ArnT family glycosyltransferase [Pelagibacterium limicola]|uniref:ArnT family glycosyltransferase n=1 Tax=Pelagibacterium limicola TaxID=2791022 RepID=UPI0018AFA069|nr:glycosyltransferase family 39 protein [Pelagibacterium limicola]